MPVLIRYREEANRPEPIEDEAKVDDVEPTAKMKVKMAEPECLHCMVHCPGVGLVSITTAWT